MTEPATHPAASLPEKQRLDYLRIAASVSIIDGSGAPEEIGRVERLARVLELNAPAVDQLIAGVRRGKLDGSIYERTVTQFKDLGPVRSALMMDAICVAFADGKLEIAETRELKMLATALGYSPAEVLEMARVAEKHLFHRQGKDQQLAASLGHVVGADEKHGAFHWLSRLFG